MPDPLLKFVSLTSWATGVLLLNIPLPHSSPALFYLLCVFSQNKCKLYIKRAFLLLSWNSYVCFPFSKLKNCVCIHVFMCIIDICVFLNHSQLSFICLLRKGISLNLALPDSAKLPDQQSQVLSCLCLPSAITTAGTATPGFHLVLGTKIRSLYLHSNTLLRKPSS